MGIFDRFRKNKQSPHGGGGVPAEPTRHCFVLCRPAQPPDLSGADTVVAKVFGRGCTAEIDDKGMVSIMRGQDMLGILAHMPAPIPNEEAQQNASGNILWPEGEQEAGQHQSHVIVTHIGGEELSPIESALRVARLALVAMDLYDGLGVYWGSASVCNSREVFEEFCSDMSEQHVPLPVLARFQLVQPAEGRFGMYTLGMQQFGLMDLEVDSCRKRPQELLEFVADLAHYLVQQGPVIADGNTVGGSESERILVRHLPSMIDKKRTVYKVIID